MTSTSSTSTTAPPSLSTDPAGDSGANGAVHRVADEAPAQAARVVDDARAQLTGAAQRSLADIRTQADERTAQAARGLHDLSTQVDALVAGRPDEAGSVVGITQAIGQHVAEFADRLDADGLNGVADDVSRFGRQHPWAFLGLSLGAGFLVGRLVRTTAAVVSDDQHATPRASSAEAPAVRLAQAPAEFASVGSVAQAPGVSR